MTATEISFVGMSMHEYLLDGLRYLFDGKQGAVEVVVANPDNKPFVQNDRSSHWTEHSNSPAFAVSRMLNSVAPQMKKVGTVRGLPTQDDITLVKDFAEFVKTQMKPVDSNSD
jgi:hypothetical protein